MVSLVEFLFCSGLGGGLCFVFPIVSSGDELVLVIFFFQCSKGVSADSPLEGNVNVYHLLNCN